ncbi:hypothetical protein MMC34_001550 [Xylographa carneopallida]|nr:hypothetical protein [Xylographa carneopallida]
MLIETSGSNYTKKNYPPTLYDAMLEDIKAVSLPIHLHNPSPDTGSFDDAEQSSYDLSITNGATDDVEEDVGEDVVNDFNDE